MSTRRARAGQVAVARLLAGTTALGLLLVACEPTAPPAEDEGQTIVIDGEREEPPAPAPDERPEADPDPGDDGGAGEPDGAVEDPPPADEQRPEATEPEPEPDPAAVVSDDRGPLGSACRPYLRGDTPALTIEVLHQSGARPSSGALEHLVASLGPVLDKPAGIDLAGPREIPGRARTWELDELRELAASHRQVHSTRDRAGMLVLAVAGEYEQPGVLGLAMNATEIVLFPQQIGDVATTLLGGSARIERSVLLHEAGHLLCLVNITYESAIDHEDPDNPRHSRHRDSVMFWAVPNDAVTQVFTGPPPDRFHADDLADLRGLREGRY